MDEWYKSDIHPNEYQDVLVWTSDDMFHVACWEEDAGWKHMYLTPDVTFEEYELPTVIRWTYLPTPPTAS